MTQKDKVKELVGRGLHSYHTKALQQMNRIVKKNKEQNHKISILTNELDNDYLTKTEEGSVISLEHSKEGMVYLDELQGNTLVNYCTDGSKEMTLNGDIDLEGTFVTTTEGVDNGKVDVMCEGNTLVNIANHPNAFTVTRTEGQTYRQYDVPLLYPLKPETTYTIYLTIDKNEFDHDPFTSIVIGQGNTDNWSNRVFWNKEFGKTNTDKGLGRHKAIFTTHSRIGESNFKFIKFIFETFQEYNTTIKDIVILEGNYSNNQDMFLGMKSVGECEDNKIEILSSKNLAPSSTHKFTAHGIEFNFGSKTINENVYVHNISNKYIMVHTSINQLYSRGFRIEKNSRKLIELNDGEVIYCTSVNRTDGWSDSDVEKARNSFIITKKENELNKKEILLNEPLRSLPNGVKDRFVKIGGKLFIERNCGEMYINVPSSGVSIDNIQEDRCRIIMADYPSNILPNQNRNTVNLVCDKIPYVKQYDIDGTNPNYSYGITTRIDNAKGIYMWVTIDKMPNQTLDGFKEFINNTQPKIIYQLETPIYEPLEIEPTLSCYSEVTHFSNNSIIPCNMKIQNSGYNAIIKPSTLYTIALDTNKSGTIGMNLGGVKGTTTNNVLKLTTPATLTDDSLRLYGKGIKGSKVRLLEGDKTNWMPSYFEGMKSSFEDKFDATDNTYKMEILSNNKNVLNLDDVVMKGIGTGCKLDACSTDLIQYTSNQAEWTQMFFMMKLKPLTRYTLSAELQSMNVYVFNDRVGTWDANKYIGAMQNTTNTLQKKQYSFTTNKNGCISIRFTNEMMLGVNIAKNIMLSEVVGEYIPKKSNKIQFSSIEPLRSVDNTKDKFVFKDNKLMIERNCGAFKINSSQGFIRVSKYDNGYLYGFEKDFDEIKRTLQSNKIIKCDKLPYYPYSGGDIAMKNINGEWIGTWSDGTTRSVIMLRLKTKDNTLNSLNEYLKENPIEIAYIKTEPTYEEIPFELQKIILEGYENGTLFFDTNIPPTSTVTYAGETPIVKSVRLNKTEVLNNTNDINDNIIPYLMDMDYRVVCLQLQSEEFNGGVSMARLFSGAYEMLQRDIQSKRYSVDEYRHRLDVYLSANKITEDEYNKLGDMLNE